MNIERLARCAPDDPEGPLALLGVTGPALVLYVGKAKATVLHFSGAAVHPNVVATVERLRRRGVAVVPPPADLEPYLEALPARAVKIACRIIDGWRRRTAPAEGTGAA